MIDSVDIQRFIEPSIDPPMDTTWPSWSKLPTPPTWKLHKVLDRDLLRCVEGFCIRHAIPVEPMPLDQSGQVSTEPSSADFFEVVVRAEVYEARSYEAGYNDGVQAEGNNTVWTTVCWTIAIAAIVFLLLVNGRKTQEIHRLRKQVDDLEQMLPPGAVPRGN